MDETAKAEFEQLSKSLRGQLKAWENEWASSHDGKKPGKGDIKQNPDIARKYKEYQQIRDILSGKQDPRSVSPKKRKPVQPPQTTPSKRAKHSTTPSKPHSRPDEQDETFTPIIPRYLFSPAPPSSLGPTPQRDGRALGLFDLLSSGGSPSAAELETPSRRGRNSIAAAAATLAAAQATPSRGAAQDGAAAATATPRRLWRTPMSSSKRQLLNTFLTPLKNGDGNASLSLSLSAGTKTPTSAGVSKLQFDTPAFLRRAPLPKIDENGNEFKDPAPLRLPKKPLGRGLSSIVASLRRVEEEVLDEDLDALRELEAEEMGAARPPPKAKPEPASPPEDTNGPNNKSAKPDQGAVGALRTKPQAPPVLLGGFDDEALYDSADEEQVGRDGQPLRVYKKKGQKRTTKLFKMKPTRFKRPAATNADQADAAIDDDEDELAATTTPADTRIDIHDDDDDDGDDPPEPGSDFAPSEDDDDETSRTSKAKAKSKNNGRSKSSGAAKAKTANGDQENVGVVKKAVRKVNAMAHANFRRLKLRNTGSKGGPGYNSRFRRRK